MDGFLLVPVTWHGEIVAWASVDADRSDVLRHNWYLNKAQYAYTSIDGRTVGMHRLILGLEYGDGLEGDHINGDGLNNLRSNLRVLTRGKNQQNLHRRTTQRELPRGVHYDKRFDFYFAMAALDGKQRYLGSFDSAEDAELAVVAWRQTNMPISYVDAIRPIVEAPPRRNPRAGWPERKLSEDAVREIRKRYRAATSVYGLWKQLAEEFGCSRLTAERTARGVLWKNVQ